MKHTKFLSILFILLIGMFFIACDQEHIERNGVTLRLATQEEFIKLRGCPITCPTGDCCCGVWLQGTDPASIAICGTSNGSGNCSGDAVGNCSSFSGGGIGPFTLTHPTTARQDFCMDVNAPFWIANTDDEEDAVIYLTCQGDLGSPQILAITIPPGERWYYETSGSCFLTACD